jgi:hypothetical protein
MDEGKRIRPYTSASFERFNHASRHVLIENVLIHVDNLVSGSVRLVPTKSGFVIYFEVVPSASPFYSDLLFLATDTALDEISKREKYRQTKFVVKVFQNENANQRKEFQNEVEKNRTVYNAYRKKYLNQPGICPRILCTSWNANPPRKELHEKEIQFLSFLMSFVPKKTKVAPTWVFYISDDRGKSVHEKLDLLLKPQGLNYMALISRPNLVTEPIAVILHEFEKTYLQYARRLFFRLAELGYGHFDHHLHNVLVDEGREEFDGKTCDYRFFYVIDLEDVYPLTKADAAYVKTQRVQEKRPHWDDGLLYAKLAGMNNRFILENGNESKFNTWRFFVDAHFKANMYKEGTIVAFEDNGDLVKTFDKEFHQFPSVMKAKEEWLKDKKSVSAFVQQLNDVFKQWFEKDPEAVKRLPASYLDRAAARLKHYYEMCLRYNWFQWTFDQGFIQFVYSSLGARLTPATVVSDAEYNNFLEKNIDCGMLRINSFAIYGPSTVGDERRVGTMDYPSILDDIPDLYLTKDHLTRNKIFANSETEPPTPTVDKAGPKPTVDKAGPKPSVDNARPKPTVDKAEPTLTVDKAASFLVTSRVLCKRLPSGGRATSASSRRTRRTSSRNRRRPVSGRRTKPKGRSRAI